MPFAPWCGKSILTRYCSFDVGLFFLGGVLSNEVAAAALAFEASFTFVYLGFSRLLSTVQPISVEGDVYR